MRGVWWNIPALPDDSSSDAARGNHTTLIEVANRGSTQMDGLFFETDEGLELMSPTR